jgi:hypothetical protein
VINQIHFTKKLSGFMKSISLTAEKNENLVQKFVPAGTSQLNNYIALNVDLCFFHKFEMKNCGVCK